LGLKKKKENEWKLVKYIEGLSKTLRKDGGNAYQCSISFHDLETITITVITLLLLVHTVSWVRGELLPQRFGDVGHEGVQEPQAGVEDVHQHPAGLGSLLRISAGST
jgi:hypothetical protein